MACALSEDSDQPRHPPSLTRVFAVRMKKALVLSYPLSAQQRLWSDWADTQTDLRHRWAHSHFVGLSWGGSIFCCMLIHFQNEILNLLSTLMNIWSLYFTFVSSFSLKVMFHLIWREKNLWRRCSGFLSSCFKHNLKGFLFKWNVFKNSLMNIPVHIQETK